MSDSIQKIKRVSLRELWNKEDKDFTKWLEEHIDFLNDAIGFDISIESREEKDDLTGLFYVGRSKRDVISEDIQIKKIKDIMVLDIEELVDKLWDKIVDSIENYH